MNEDIIK